MFINPNDQNGLNYSPDVAGDVFEKIEQSRELEDEARHWQAVKEAKREYRKQGLDFYSQELEDRWMDLTIKIKAYEFMATLGWDTENQIADLMAQADDLVAEDEELVKADRLQELELEYELEARA